MTQAQAELLARICNLHANGAITGAEVSTQLRRFQNTMTAMLAIEQLTSRSQVTTLALTTDAGSGTGDGVAGAQQDQAKAALVVTDTTSAVTLQESKISQAEQVLKEKQAKRDAASTNSPDKTTLAGDAAIAETTLQTERAQLTSVRNAQTQARATAAAADRAIQAARLTVRSNASGTTNKPGLLPAGVVVADTTATAIREIVFRVLDQSYMQETCLQLMINGDTARLVGQEKSVSGIRDLAVLNPGLNTECSKILAAAVAYHLRQLELAGQIALIDARNSNPSRPPNRPFTPPPGSFSAPPVSMSLLQN